MIVVSCRLHRHPAICLDVDREIKSSATRHGGQPMGNLDTMIALTRSRSAQR
jgi:hypothetical protein